MNGQSVKNLTSTNGGTIDTSKVKSWYNDNYDVSASGLNRYYKYNIAYITPKTGTDYNCAPDTRMITKSGATLDGWYTAQSGGTKLFNSDGTLVKGVSGYSDSSGKWIKYDANLTVYAQWK